MANVHAQCNAFVMSEDGSTTYLMSLCMDVSPYFKRFKDVCKCPL